MSAATPRPWRACSCGKCGQIASIPADVQVANALCDYAMADEPLPTEEAQRANLALIVAAVNSYEAHQRAAEALRKIVDMQPEEYAFPADWHEQIAACAECQRYEGHPIQQGICNEHRRPLRARESFDAAEPARMLIRARREARAALAALAELDRVQR